MAHAAGHQLDVRSQLRRAPGKPRAPRRERLERVELTDAKGEDADPLRPCCEQRHRPGEEPLLPQGEDVDILPDRFIADPRTPDGRDRSGDLVQGRELRSNRLLLGFEIREGLFDQPLRCSEELLERDQTRERSGDLSQRRVVREAVEGVGEAGQQEPELRPGCERSSARIASERRFKAGTSSVGILSQA